MRLPAYREVWFPNLPGSVYRITSTETEDYNCIAHAADHTANEIDMYSWWPDEDYFWPDGIPRVENLDAFVLAFQRMGYSPCADGSHEIGVEKIVIYTDQFRNDVPTHAARQLESGKWTSKLGGWEDIEHRTPEDVAGYHGREARYGTVSRYMARPTCKAGDFP